MLSLYHDWQLAFDKYFVSPSPSMKDLSIVELGKGEGTLYLHKNFKKVFSIEYCKGAYKTSWEDAGLEGHILENMETPSNINELDSILIHSNGAVRPPELAKEAEKLYLRACYYQADVLFIDHGVHNRGEVLELAKKGQWKYIIIHDSNAPFYGYNLKSEDHSVYNFPNGAGTVIFKKLVSS
jgi:hypothetical protein